MSRFVRSEVRIVDQCSLDAAISIDRTLGSWSIATHVYFISLPGDMGVETGSKSSFEIKFLVLLARSQPPQTVQAGGCLSGFPHAEEEPGK